MKRVIVRGVIHHRSTSNLQEILDRRVKKKSDENLQNHSKRYDSDERSEEQREKYPSEFEDSDYIETLKSVIFHHI